MKIRHCLKTLWCGMAQRSAAMKLTPHARAGRLGHATTTGWTNFQTVPRTTMNRMGWMVLVVQAAAAWPTLAQLPPDSDDEVRERLIRKAQGQEDEDLMGTILRLMGQTQQRLAESFDAGPATQSLQQEILKHLEQAVELARQNMKLKQSESNQQGDKRQGGQPDVPPPDANQGGDQPGDQSGDQERDSPGGADKVEAAKAGQLEERRRSWGHLPDRQREEIIQGINEDANEQYREQIRRYYESLGQPEEE